VQSKLYYFIGYPGAGKTTLAKAIAQASGAVHLWADDERHKFFPEATHSHEESLKLYDILNHRAEQLLGEGKSVVFDTNFNFYHDHQTMRDIAARQNAEPVLIWLDVPVDVARDRAVCSDKIRNGYKISMSDEQFASITSKLEPPRENEKFIKIDSTKLDALAALKLLGL
jgi:predicted kinase